MKANINYCLALGILCVFSGCKDANSPQEEAAFNKLSVYETLLSINNVADSSRQQIAVADFWSGLIDSASIPYVKNDTAIILYKGTARKVEWNGDFNSWGGDNSFINEGKQIGTTGLWYLLKTFPEDARLDYKITLNSNNWILDPNNPNQQWSGFGPNSELRMPKWERETIGRDRGAAAAKIDSFSLFSTALNYTVAYKVFLPEGYSNMNELPIMYVTDGHEYQDSELGNLINITQNLIADERIMPIILILIDPRNPTNLNQNRRQEEYTINSKYLTFVAEELFPTLKENYKISTEKQAILGTSLGGLNASYFGAVRPDLFPYIAIQSPAYWYKPEIFDTVNRNSETKQKAFISAGTFNDGLVNALRMKEIYEENGHEVAYLEVNEGHSWGAWTQQLDNILIYFFGK